MKSALIILVAALVLTNGAWAYHLIDQSITLQHQTEELTRQRSIQELLASLVVDLQGTKSRADVMAIVRQKYGNRIVKTDNGNIEIEGVVLRFRGDTLMNVSTL